MACTARCGLPVGLFTSMTGAVKYPYPPYGGEQMSKADADARYRIVALDGDDADGRRCSVVGFFEPIRGFERGQGAAAIVRDGTVSERIEPLPDDNTRTHLDGAARYFSGRGPNPCSAEDGLRAVETLHAMFQLRLRAMQAAIDARRPSAGISVSELVDVDDGLLGHVLQWMIRRPQVVVSVDALADQIGQSAVFVEPLLGRLEARGLVERCGAGTGCGSRSGAGASCRARSGRRSPTASGVRRRDPRRR